MPQGPPHPDDPVFRHQYDFPRFRSSVDLLNPGDPPALDISPSKPPRHRAAPVIFHLLSLPPPPHGPPLPFRFVRSSGSEYRGSRSFLCIPTAIDQWFFFGGNFSQNAPISGGTHAGTNGTYRSATNRPADGFGPSVVPEIPLEQHVRQCADLQLFRLLTVPYGVAGFCNSGDGGLAGRWRFRRAVSAYATGFHGWGSRWNMQGICQTPMAPHVGFWQSHRWGA